MITGTPLAIAFEPAVSPCPFSLSPFHPCYPLIFYSDMNSEQDNRKLHIFLTGLLAVVVVLAVLAPGAFRTLVLAFALAYLMNPLVGFLEDKGVPRALSILSILTVIVGLIVLGLAIVVPFLLEEGIAFVGELPELIQGAFEKIRVWPVWQSLGLEIPSTIAQILEQLSFNLKEKGLSVLTPALAAVFNLTSGILGFILGIVSLVVIPLFFFFILKDLEFIEDGFYSFVPHSGREQVRKYLEMVDQVLGGFIRGQILVASALAVLYAVGLGITGIRFGVVIGVISGILFIIPYVGTIIGITASSIVLIVDFSGWGQVIAVVAVFAIAQSIEGYILTPRITGDRVGLNQLETLISIMIGGEIGGMTGLLVAIPAGGIVKKTFLMMKPESEGSGRELGSTGGEAHVQDQDEEKKGNGEEEKQ